MADKKLVFDIFAKDRASKVFDGVGSKAEGLGSRVAKVGKGIAVGLGVTAAAGVASLAAGMFEGVKAASRYQDLAAATTGVLESTGNAAHTSVKRVQELAGSLESMSGVDEELIIHGENVLLTFTRIRNEAGKGNDVFDQATKAALNMSSALGTDMQSSATLVGKALNDPIKGLTALGRVGVAFTDQQKKQIKSLVESGRTMDAQKIILAELNTEYGNAAEASGQGFAGSMARAKDAVGDAFRSIGTLLLPVLTKAADFFTKRIAPAIQGTIDLLFKGDFTKAFREAFGVEEDSAVVDFLFDVRDKFIALVGWVKTNGPKIKQWLADTWNDHVLPALKAVSSFITGTVIPAAKSLFGFVKDNNPVFRTLGVAVLAMVVAFKAWTTAVKIWQGVVKAATVIQAAFNLVMAANPIGIIILALIGLAAGIAYAWTHFKTFRDVVKRVGAFVIGIFQALVNTWMTVVGWIIDGAVKAFGWVPGIGDKLKGAQKAFHGFKDSVNAELDKIQTNLTLDVDTIKALKDVTAFRIAASKELSKTAVKSSGGKTFRVFRGLATGGDVDRGEAVVVGEHGPEIFKPRVPGTVIPNGATSARAVASEPERHDSVDRLVAALERARFVIDERGFARLVLAGNVLNARRA